MTTLSTTGEIDDTGGSGGGDDGDDEAVDEIIRVVRETVPSEAIE